MKTMRAALVAFATGAILMALPLEAQQRGPRGGGMGADLEAQMELLSERLELSGEQTLAVREILEAQTQKRREAMQAMREGGGDRQMMRSTMLALQEETETRLSEVLSEGQMETYRELRAERRARRGPPIG